MPPTEIDWLSIFLFVVFGIVLLPCATIARSWIASRLCQILSASSSIAPIPTTRTANATES